MPAPGFQLADLAGTLGPGSTDRLGRVLFEGTIAAGDSITLLNLNFDLTNSTTMNASTGFIFLTAFPYRVYSNVSDTGLLTWNNTTKVLTAVGAPRSIIVISFRNTDPPIGGVGMVINNSAGDTIIDNVHPNLELVSSGSLTSSGISDVKTMPVEASLGGSFTMLRWPMGQALVRGGGRQVALDLGGTIDYRIYRINPVYSCIAGGPPGLCLTRGSDGLVLFDSKRTYGRLKTLIQFENYSFDFEGGSGGNSYWSHNAIPTTSFFRVDTHYASGTRVLAIARVTTTQWTSFIFDRVAYGLSGAWQTSLGLVSVGTYPGGILPVTLVADA
ncbi:MAG: hypothetical protein ACK4NE_00150 [Albidovulum sp.]